MTHSFLKTLQRLGRPLMGKGYGKLPVIRSFVAWYKKQNKPEYVMIEGRRLYLNPQDEELAPYLAMHGYFEKMETELVRQYVQPGMRVLDVGANIGYFTVLCSALVGKEGSIVAIEPDVTNYSFLEKSVQELPEANVQLVKAAAWHSSGTLNLHLNKSNPGDHQTFPGEDSRESYKVQATAIDDIETASRGFDFVKMDIQGAEGQALRGMQNTLASHRPAVMILEFWPSSLERAGTPPEDVYTSIVQLGYQLQRISNEEGKLYPINSYQQIADFCDLDWKFVNLLCTHSA